MEPAQTALSSAQRLPNNPQRERNRRHHVPFSIRSCARSEPTETGSPSPPSAAGLRWMASDKDAASSLHSPAICWQAAQPGSCNCGTAPHAARTLFATGDEGARESPILSRSPVARAFSLDRESLAGFGGFYRSNAEQLANELCAAALMLAAAAKRLRKHGEALAPINLHLLRGTEHI